MSNQIIKVRKTIDQCCFLLKRFTKRRLSREKLERGKQLRNPPRFSLLVFVSKRGTNGAHSRLSSTPVRTRAARERGQYHIEKTPENESFSCGVFPPSKPCCPGMHHTNALCDERTLQYTLPFTPRSFFYSLITSLYRKCSAVLW